jgi:hypothetical protein
MLQVIVLLGAFAAAIVVVLGTQIIKAYSRKVDIDARSNRPSEDVTYRLERIEHAIEAMAIEVERITEGQRFTTRLLSESRKSLEPAGLPEAPR